MVNAINPLNPVQINNNPNQQTMPADVFPGQRHVAGNEMPQLVVDRKQETSAAREEIPREEVEKATDKLNRLMGLVDKRRIFRIHEETHRLMIKIIDERTDEVLAEIPPERLLDILSGITKAVGIQVDKRI